MIKIVETLMHLLAIIGGIKVIIDILEKRNINKALMDEFINSLDNYNSNIESFRNEVASLERRKYDKYISPEEFYYYYDNVSRNLLNEGYRYMRSFLWNIKSHVINLKK